MKNMIPERLKRSFIITIWWAYIFLASGLIVNFFQFLTLPLWFLGFKRAYRQCIVNLNYSFWCILPGVAHWWADIEIYIHGRPEDFIMLGKEKMLAVLNHRGQLDWVLCWVIADYSNILGKVQCLVKNIIGYVPALGWSFWFSEYIFLKRNIEDDRATIHKGFKNISSFAHNFWLLIFCEGTRFTAEQNKRSNEYAIKNGLRPLKNLLVPRTKGFLLIAKGLRDSVETFYDATVCLRGQGDKVTFKEMLQGKSCVADFIARRVPIAEVPVEEEKCIQYIHDVYYEKDQLCEFHNHHDAFPINGEDPKYQDFIQKKVPKNYLILFLLIFWAIVCTVPLAYGAFCILFFGTWTQVFVFTTVVTSVVAVLNFILAMFD